MLYMCTFTATAKIKSINLIYYMIEYILSYITKNGMFIFTAIFNSQLTCDQPYLERKV